MRTAKKLGLQTVDVYSDADRDSLHVKFADEVVRIDPPPAKLSFLQANSIIEAARMSGAQIEVAIPSLAKPIFLLDANEDAIVGVLM
ncbi:hypothetical protein SOVF_210210 [Spinacia oleracea]|nr:hypothetical protein SOVF_210210 [Spinacia oleracea]